MLDKNKIVAKMQELGSPEAPLSELVHGSLELANLCASLVEELGPAQRDQVLELILMQLDLTHLSLRELLDRVDEHLRNS